MDQFYSQQWPLLPAKVRSQLMADGFSPAGRRNIFSVSLGKTYRYDADNRLLNVSQDIHLDGWLFHVGDVRYDYDNNGNRILKSELMADDVWPLETRYTYDVENRLTQLDFSTKLSSLGDSKAHFEYDSHGRRVKAIEGPHVTNFLYDGTKVILAKDTLSLTEDSYTRGLDEGGGIGGIISRTRYPLQTEYFYYNPQGSVTNLSNKNGTASAAYDYDAYGQTSPAWQAGTNPYRFSTKEWVGYTNLYYFGARYYDPEIGRWLTPDPLGFINGPNMYLYCLDNPINFIDPTGEGLIGAGVGLTVGGYQGFLTGLYRSGGNLQTAFESAAVGATVGGLTGLAVPDNPLVGAVAGAAGSYAANVATNYLTHDATPFTTNASFSVLSGGALGAAGALPWGSILGGTSVADYGLVEAASTELETTVATQMLTGSVGFIADNVDYYYDPNGHALNSYIGNLLGLGSSNGAPNFAGKERT